jgi:hypothetical protein
MLFGKSSFISKNKTMSTLSAMFNASGARRFATITPAATEHLKKLGINNTNIVYNPT